MRDSLHRRLFGVGAGVVLACVVGIGLALDAAFRDSAEDAQRDRLQGLVYTLLAAVEVTPETITVDTPLPDPRLARPRSGLYAWVLGPEGQAIWRSHSTLGSEQPKPRPVAPGSSVMTSADGHYRLRYGVAWERPDGPTRRFAVAVAEDESAVRHQVAAFRRTLWGWLLLGAAVLVTALALALHWTLAPLRRVATDLERMRAGAIDRLPADYPREIRLLTDRINAGMEAERARGERFRRNLDDLAHSLKTPLAVLRGALRDIDRGARTEAAEQVARIDASLDYYVRRGGAGIAVGSGRVAVRPVAERLLQALGKAHADRRVEATLEADPELTFAGNEADLMELLGNLADNAFKWAAGRVRVRADRNEQGHLRLSVEDDGPGIPAAQRRRVLDRGARADEAVPGEGIGLSVADAVVRAYGGTLTIGDAGLGGARVTVTLPGDRAG